MAKHIIRYLLEGDGSVPKFVEEGGYFPVDDELVGRSCDEDKRHLPSTVYKLTKAELIQRCMLTVHTEDYESLLDESAATAFVEAWLARLDMADYE